MAPTTRQATNTKLGEGVLDLVIPYLHNVEDRNSVSLVSRKCYDIDGITRKRLTVHTLYYPNPASLSKRFPFIESLTLKGPPSIFDNRDSYVIRITPWIQQLALEFRCLKQLHIRHLVIHDEDLETLTRTRGKDLRTLKINKCEGYSSVGLRHVSKYCNQLRTLCLGHSYDIDVNDGIWLHELASNSMFLERLHVENTHVSYAEDITLLAKSCSNSLKSLKIGKCYLSKLGDAFRYAIRLEHFGGNSFDEENDLVGFEFPQNMRSISMWDLSVTRCSIVVPYLNQIRKLKLRYFHTYDECQCLLFKQCPNLEVLYTEDECGDRGLQLIGKFCKKLRKLTHHGCVTHVTKGCTNLESLDFFSKDISNEALECVGTHLKNLHDFCILMAKKNTIRYLPLDNGVSAMLMGCSKLEKLHIRSLWHGGLTDVGLEYIGKYGANLRSLVLECVGNLNTGLVKSSNAGLVKLSEGCSKLRKLELRNFGFSEQVATSVLFNIPSLRYVCSNDLASGLALTRPEVEQRNIGRSKLKRKSPTSDGV